MSIFHQWGHKWVIRTLGVLYVPTADRVKGSVMANGIESSTVLGCRKPKLDIQIKLEIFNTFKQFGKQSENDDIYENQMFMDRVFFRSLC